MSGLTGSADSALSLDRIYFEDTLAAKVDRVASLDLDVFIDDLIDVFEQPHFPARTQAILFAGLDAARGARFRSAASWAEIQNEVFAA